MKNIKSYFLFSSEHRGGIFLLALIIVVLQVVIFVSRSDENENEIFFDKITQNEIDSLRIKSMSSKTNIKLFNPNFISDYKGFMLGMSTKEIDRLLEFRKKGKYINSSNEFQLITGVSDSLLDQIAPFFKFPVFKEKKKLSFKDNLNRQKNSIIPVNLNLATKEDLMKVNGIGDKISDIILSERGKFRAFKSIDQLKYIWGVDSLVFERCKEYFFVEKNVEIEKIKINNLSIKELVKFPYFNYKFSKEIVTYRSMNGSIRNIEDLAKINYCPLEKIEIIALYLDF